MNRHQDSRPAGFTVIELLVVVAVISILAALAFPAYNRSIQGAQSAGCVSNLRQLGAALSAYLGDNDMRMPVMQALRASTADNVPVIDNTLNRYVTNPAVFACPADNQGLAAKSGTSYYWNAILSGTGGQSRGQSLANLSFLGLTQVGLIPVMADKAGFHPNSEHQVNLLYADGHVSKDLTFSVASN